jgi:hypothetical protein
VNKEEWGRYLEATGAPVNYEGRPLPDRARGWLGRLIEKPRYGVTDVRHFVTGRDARVRAATESALAPTGRLGEMGLAAAATACEGWVRRHLRYVSDERYGVAEYWLYPWETLQVGVDDCEGGACVLASMLYHALPAVDHERVHVRCGLAGRPGDWTGHAYVTMLLADGRLVRLDWCAAQMPVEARPDVREDRELGEVWFWFGLNGAHVPLGAFVGRSAWARGKGAGLRLGPERRRGR